MMRVCPLEMSPQLCLLESSRMESSLKGLVDTPIPDDLSSFQDYGLEGIQSALDIGDPTLASTAATTDWLGDLHMHEHTPPHYKSYNHMFLNLWR